MCVSVESDTPQSFYYTPQNIKSHVSSQGGEKLFRVISLPQTLLSALPFMLVIVGDYFNCEKGSR